MKEGEKMRNVTMEEVFELGKKYKMDLSDSYALKKVLIIGVIAVEKCIKLGVGKEMEAEFENEMKRLMRRHDK